MCFLLRARQCMFKCVMIKYSITEWPLSVYMFKDCHSLGDSQRPGALSYLHDIYTAPLGVAASPQLQSKDRDSKTHATSVM